VQQGGPVGVLLAVGAQHTCRGEVAALGYPVAVDGHEHCRERGDFGRSSRGLRCEIGLKIPVLGRAEGDALTLPVHNQAHCHGLDPASRKLRHDLLPQHRRQLVPVQPVQHPPSLVCLDQAVVHIARRGDGLGDRLGRYLVEDHPLGRYPRLEFLHQVPGNGLALAVLISGEQEFVSVLEQLLELCDLLPFVGIHDIKRLEVMVDIDAQASPRFASIFCRNLSSLIRHITNMADAGFHDVVLAKEASDRPRLPRRLDDDQRFAAVGPGSRPTSGFLGPCCHVSTFYIQQPPRRLPHVSSQPPGALAFRVRDTASVRQAA